MTSVQHSESVVVRTLTNCQLEVTNVLEQGTTSSSKYYIQKEIVFESVQSQRPPETVFALPLNATLDTQ